MLMHLMLMNAMVPIGVYVLKRLGRLPRIWRIWPWATAAQLAMLWGWHSPVILSAATQNLGLMMLMQVNLGGAAALFWISIASMPQHESWRAIMALLITGKLFCLLGALLVFSPNLLFYDAGANLMPAAGALADQQLAGIIMLVACPLSYVTAGIILASRWVLALEDREEFRG
ncbi:cytochrome c oxidase assembly protein [Devosia salina]|uniref:Cytochrome c oxidase assembly protein n=1 Tax=Devosia salina TaxID=2860336 RepID=A0ABX8WBJ4_9HYPH|nr:cytochrome c oxidase assembly protein [Devosia salina]QYO76062.1 cytochrome c oxidase assembly protein [Devosia salina]